MLTDFNDRQPEVAGKLLAIADFDGLYVTIDMASLPEQAARS